MATIRDLVAKVPADQHQVELDATAVQNAQQVLADAQAKDTIDMKNIGVDMLAAAAAIKAAGGFVVDVSDPARPVLYTASADGQTFTSVAVPTLDQLA